MNGTLRIRPQKLFEQITSCQLKNEPTFSYLLFDDFTAIENNKKLPVPTQNLPFVKAKAAETTSALHTIELPKYEVDLHIDALMPDNKGMNKSEIIIFQLETARHYLQLALVHRLDRMVLIHGIGKGKLKEELHNILSKMPDVDHFVNEWHGRYGFGATEVFFKY